MDQKQVSKELETILQLETNYFRNYFGVHKNENKIYQNLCDIAKQL